MFSPDQMPAQIEQIMDRRMGGHELLSRCAISLYLKEGYRQVNGLKLI